MYIDPNGENPLLVPIIIGAVMGAVQGAMIASASGAQGGQWAAYIFGGAVIGAVAGGIGGTVAGVIGQGAFLGSGMVGAMAGGAISGAVSGLWYTALAGGNALDGAWKGAVSGLAGGLVSSSIGGGIGAFAGGFASGVVGSALNGAKGADILKAGLIGGATSFGCYQLSQGIGYGMYKKAGGEWNYRQYYKASVSIQRSLAWGREISGWITDNDIVGLAVGGRNGKVGMTDRPDNAVASFHTHTRNNQFTVEWQSPTDLRGKTDVGYVLGWSNTYKHDPSTHPLPLDYNSGNWTDAYLTMNVNPGLLSTYNYNFNRFPFYLFYFIHKNK